MPVSKRRYVEMRKTYNLNLLHTASASDSSFESLNMIYIFRWSTLEWHHSRGKLSFKGYYSHDFQVTVQWKSLHQTCRTLIMNDVSGGDENLTLVSIVERMAGEGDGEERYLAADSGIDCQISEVTKWCRWKDQWACFPRRWKNIFKVQEKINWRKGSKLTMLTTNRCCRWYDRRYPSPWVVITRSAQIVRSSFKLVEYTVTRTVTGHSTSVSDSSESLLLVLPYHGIHHNTSYSWIYTRTS